MNIEPDPIGDVIWKGRRCTGCGSEKVVAVSGPRELGEGKPFAARRLGKCCWCEKCFLLLIDKSGGNA
jgi:hypothetical protein